MITNKDFEDFLDNDQKAFKKVFETYQHVLMYYVVEATQNESTAEEIVQEAFIQLFLQKDKLSALEQIYPFLFTVVKRQTISTYRRKMSSKRYMDELRALWSEAEHTVLERIAGAEIQEAFDKSVDELPLRQKQVFLLSKLENKSYQEIADHLGVSKNTVKNQLISATKIIKLKLARFQNLILSFFLFFL
ncbi:MAG: sigma-70 family RNA polymerase sigma factor [Sphingobacterium sp.]|jgi:RNA polymerase sigma-70 factor (ECF subfamily)|nr:sigma-70 family RNA polymerase sigma factor [Sphingobacterium sp.]